MENSTEEFGKKLETLEVSIDVQSKLFSSFLAKMDSYFEKFEKKADESASWLKTLHEMALKEYMSGPKKRVYAFVYSRKNATEDRLILACRDTFEDAHESARHSLESIGENPDRDWMMASFKFIDVPQGDPRLVDNVVKKLPAYEKPIDNYLNSLSLLRDRFCSTSSEIRSVNRLIEKVKKSYK